MRVGLPGKNAVLLYEVDLGAQFVDGHVVAEVPVEPVRLFHKNSAAVGILLQERHHVAEAGAAGGLGRLDVDELLRDRVPARGAVGTEELELGGDGKAFLLLIAR